MKFIENLHKYIEDGQEYTPVTYIIKSFQEPVNWNEVAAKKAKKEGVTTEALLAQWEEKRDKAAQKGTAYHKMMEDKYKVTTGMNIEDQHCAISWADTIDGIKEELTVRLENNKIYTEKMIWSRIYKVCGTADLVEVVNGRINVKDYKTSEKIEKESWRHPNPAIGKKKLLSPLKHLDDCGFNIYQLQLNIYMYMLLKQNPNYRMGKMEILHIPFDENGAPGKPDVHVVKNMQREVEAIFKHLAAKKK